jgi:hypothetical protein
LGLFVFAFAFVFLVDAMSSAPVIENLLGFLDPLGVIRMNGQTMRILPLGWFLKDGNDGRQSSRRNCHLDSLSQTHCHERAITHFQLFVRGEPDANEKTFRGTMEKMEFI